MQIKMILAALLCTALLLIVNCTSSANIEIAGGASDLEISACVIDGKAVDMYGNVLIGAKVILRPSDYLSGSSTPDTSTKRYADTITDTLGYFKFEAIDTGSYSIELNFNDSIGTISYVEISRDDRIKSLATVNLLPMASISGKIDISGDSIDVNCIYLQVIGLERNVKADSTGYYSVKVPSGKHHLFFQNDSSELIIQLGPGEPKTVDIRISDYRGPISQYTNDSTTLRILLDSLYISQSAFDSVSRFENGKLATLDLSGRELQHIPLHLMRFQRLRQLYLNDNQLGDTFTLPPDMRGLEKLDLKNNRIMNLSNSISSMDCLQFLDLSYNDLTTLPLSIMRLRLYTFDISYNSIDSDALSEELIRWLNTNDPDWSSSQKQIQ